MDGLHPVYKKTYAAKSGNGKSLPNFNTEIKPLTKPTKLANTQNTTSNKGTHIEKGPEKKQARIAKRPLSSEQEVCFSIYLAFALTLLKAAKLEELNKRFAEADEFQLEEVCCLGI